MHGPVHNETQLEIIIIKELEHTIANNSIFLVTSIPIYRSISLSLNNNNISNEVSIELELAIKSNKDLAVEVIVSLLLSNENSNDSSTRTKNFHDKKPACAITQSTHDKVLQLRSSHYL